MNARTHVLIWLSLISAEFAVAAYPDVIRETFGVDRFVAVAGLMGGFCAVTFAGSLALTASSILGSLARVIASGSVGMYCGGLAAPLVTSTLGAKVGSIAPAPAAFLVALAAPLIYARIAGRLKKEQ